MFSERSTEQGVVLGTFQNCFRERGVRFAEPKKTIGVPAVPQRSAVEENPPIFERTAPSF